MPTLATDPTIKQEKEIRGKQFGKEKVKLSLYADDMISYTENSKRSTKQLLEIVYECSTVTEYKIVTQKSTLFLSTNNEVAERKTKEIISLVVTTERISRHKFNQRGERPGNYKTWLKEAEGEGFLGCSVVKNPAASAGDMSSVPHPGRCCMQPSMSALAPQL